jgi:adenylosuccinate synthase
MATQPHAILVVDLAFGDCGKGTIVDFLTRTCAAHTVIRFNGGPQAGHNVVTSDKRQHTFSQFGSGTFVPGVRTLLSRFMLIEPYALFNEAKHLYQMGVKDAWRRLLIDARCFVITPAQQAANRLREIARGDHAHGTCGVGVGEAMQDQTSHPELMLHAGDLANAGKVRGKLRAILDLKIEELRDVIAAMQSHPSATFSVETLLDASWIDAAVENYAVLAQRASIIDESKVRAAMRQAGTLIFEGAQGVLLDENYGFHPYTTWSTTTFANAEALLDEVGYDGLRTKIGVLRTYFTRHGVGPLVPEDDLSNAKLEEPHNDEFGWQGRFRVGAFDAVAARYALAAAGPIDALAITHLDRLPQLPRHVCNGYRDDAKLASSLGSTDLDWFERDGSQIKNVRVQRHATLAQRERLTQMLCRCHPIYTQLPNAGAEACLDMIVRELRVPVGITSLGPTANDKHIVQADWLRR